MIYFYLIAGLWLFGVCMVVWWLMRRNVTRYYGGSPRHTPFPSSYTNPLTDSSPVDISSSWSSGDSGGGGYDGGGGDSGGGGSSDSY
jgi:uncharacterized membrane protein YgcG